MYTLLLSVAKDYKKLKMCRLFHMQDLSAFYLHLRSCKEKKEQVFCSFKCCRLCRVFLIASPANGRKCSSCVQLWRNCASLREDFSKGMQNKVLDPLVITGVKISNATL